MKTSNKILLALGLICFAYVLGYNMVLRKEFKKGDYKKPYYGMHKIDLPNFAVVNNQAGPLVGIQVKYGRKHEVWVRPDVEAMLQFTSDGHTLNIKTSQSAEQMHFVGEWVVITCPQLDSVITGGQVNEKNRQFVDYFDPHLRTKVQGFTQSHLSVVANNRTLITLDNNKIGELSTFLGDRKGGRGYLTITDNNKIDFADLNVNGRSVLTVFGLSIAKSNNHISDSASVSLNHGALALLLGAKNIPQ